MAENLPRSDAAIWFRLLLPSGALGPGKIALMRAVVVAGSVSGAARSLRMSHARSVKLVAEINALAGLTAGPLIDTRTGGQAGGGAALTALGLDVLAGWDALEAAVAAAAAGPIAGLAAVLGRQ